MYRLELGMFNIQINLEEKTFFPNSYNSTPRQRFL